MDIGNDSKDNDDYTENKKKTKRKRGLLKSYGLGDDQSDKGTKSPSQTSKNNDEEKDDDDYVWNDGGVDNYMCLDDDDNEDAIPLPTIMKTNYSKGKGVTDASEDNRTPIEINEDQKTNDENSQKSLK